MACAGCPRQSRNCTAHRVFIERLQAWLAVISTGTPPASLIRDIHAETCRWIENHIAGIDIGLRASPAAAAV